MLKFSIAFFPLIEYTKGMKMLPLIDGAGYKLFDAKMLSLTDGASNKLFGTKMLPHLYFEGEVFLLEAAYDFL